MVLFTDTKVAFGFTGFNDSMLFFKNFHEILGSCPAKKWDESVVLLGEEGVAILDLCLLNLCLKFFAKPTYVCMLFPFSEVTVAR